MKLFKSKKNLKIVAFIHASCVDIHKEKNKLPNSIICFVGSHLMKHFLTDFLTILNTIKNIYPGLKKDRFVKGNSHKKNNHLKARCRNSNLSYTVEHMVRKTHENTSYRLCKLA